MNVKQFQEISQIKSGATYEEELISYFKIDKNQTLDKVSKDLESALQITPLSRLMNYIKVGTKFYTYEKDLLECTYEQFSRLDMILSEENNIMNLNKLLAIYFRPVNLFGRIKKFNLKTQDFIAEDLLKLDMNIAQTLILFFYQDANKSLDYIKIHYLNQMKMNIMEPIKNK